MRLDEKDLIYGNLKLIYNLPTKNIADAFGVTPRCVQMRLQKLTAPDIGDEFHKRFFVKPYLCGLIFCAIKTNDLARAKELIAIFDNDFEALLEGMSMNLYKFLLPKDLDALLKQNNPKSLVKMKSENIV